MKQQIILKYPLQGLQMEKLRLPKSAKILHVDYQLPGLKLWVLCEAEHLGTLELRYFQCLLTGHEFPAGPEIERVHLGTVFMGTANFVVHVFEVVNGPLQLEAIYHQQKQEAHNGRPI